MKKYSDNISEGCRERLWSVEIFGQLTCLWLDKEKFYDEIFMLFLSSENVVRSAYIDFWQIFITNRWRGGKIDENFRDGMKSKSQNLTMKFYLPLKNLKFKYFHEWKFYTSQNCVPHISIRNFYFHELKCKECQKACLTYSFCKRIEKCMLKGFKHIEPCTRERKQVDVVEIFKVYVKNPLSQLGAVSVNLFIRRQSSTHTRLDSLAI